MCLSLSAQTDRLTNHNKMDSTGTLLSPADVCQQAVEHLAHIFRAEASDVTQIFTFHNVVCWSVSLRASISEQKLVLQVLPLGTLTGADLQRLDAPVAGRRKVRALCVRKFFVANKNQFGHMAVNWGKWCAPVKNGWPSPTELYVLYISAWIWSKHGLNM